MNSTAVHLNRNIGLLAACQAMLFTNNSTLIAINGLAGLALAPHPALATLTVTCWVLGGALATMPASLHMKRVGRQAGLMSGTAWGIAGALICGLAIYLQNFWMLCLGTLVWGVYNAYGQYYRFAAADASTPEFRPKAISLVLAGGLVGGILGPTLSRWTVDLLPQKFMGAYLVLIIAAVITMMLLRQIRIPAPSDAEPPRAGAAGPAAARDRRAAEVHGRGTLGRHQLRRDELPHGVDADRHAGVRACVRRHGDRDLLAHRRHVRAVVLHRQPDQALRR